MCGIVCVAASRGGVGMGSGSGGEAQTEMQRSRNAAKESCVAASASVTDRRSLVMNLWMGSTECDLWAGHRT